ncbi:MAG TPA: phosphatase PAP2 family protein [Gaiellaceae bacterium]|nr:phosphatase PAP2 family protein [Gaiellaceae bacterium]
MIASERNRPRASAAREGLLILLAALVYAAVRVFTEGNRAQAEANGRRILRLEQALHINSETALQSPVLAHEWLATLANWFYIWGFWPVLAGTALFLYTRHPAEYVLLRNAVFVSGLAGFLFFALLPVAPPRLVDPALVDTIREHTTWYRTLSPLKVTNQYAAMPSLHVGWSLLVGVAVARATRRWIGYAFAVLMPVAMALAVVVTANHSSWTPWSAPPSPPPPSRLPCICRICARFIVQSCGRPDPGVVRLDDFHRTHTRPRSREMADRSLDRAPSVCAEER